MHNEILLEKDAPFKGKQWIDKYNGLLNDANKRRTELLNSLSQFDKEQDDILHYVEMKKCDAVMMVKLMKKLKEVREQRRIVKEELQALESINQLSKKSKVKNNPTYTFKTNIIIDLLEGEGNNEN